MDDLTAIRRLKCGDIEGLGVLVERYQVEAMRTAYLITHDLSLADDVVQESFLRVNRYIHHVDENRPFVPYFMRIVVNAAIEISKRTRQHEASFPSLDAEMIDGFFPDTIFDLEHEVEATELSLAVWDALRQLAPEQCAAVVLRYYFDYSEREIAEALSTPQGTISWRLHRARKQLGITIRSFWNPGVSSQKGEVR